MEKVRVNGGDDRQMQNVANTANTTSNTDVKIETKAGSVEWSAEDIRRLQNSD